MTDQTKLRTCIEKLHEMAGYFFKKAKDHSYCNKRNSEIMMDRYMTCQIAADILSSPTPPTPDDEVMDILSESGACTVGGLIKCYKKFGERFEAEEMGVKTPDCDCVCKVCHDTRAVQTIEHPFVSGCPNCNTPDVDRDEVVELMAMAALNTEGKKLKCLIAIFSEHASAMLTAIESKYTLIPKEVKDAG